MKSSVYIMLLRLEQSHMPVSRSDSDKRKKFPQLGGGTHVKFYKRSCSRLNKSFPIECETETQNGNLKHKFEDRHLKLKPEN